MCIIHHISVLNRLPCSASHSTLFVSSLSFHRRMFPTVRVSFSGPLRNFATDRYAVIIDVVPLDTRRYRYAYHRSTWLVAGKADPPPPARLYCHPDTPLGADALKKQIISFEKVKVTNNELDKTGHVSCAKDLTKKRLSNFIISSLTVRSCLTRCTSISRAFI